jgi:hypothetical protein
MLSCEIDDPTDSLGCHALEDVGGDLFGAMVVGVFKDCPDGQAGALHDGALKPVATFDL